MQVPPPLVRSQANGLKVSVNPCYGGLATIIAAVPCGAAHERDGTPAGAALLLGRLLTQGSALHPTAEALAFHLESLGAVYSAGTDEDMTTVLASVPVTDLAAALPAVLDMALQPLLAPTPLRIERRRLAGQFRAATAVPASKAGEQADKLLWPDSPEGRTAAEMARAILKLTRDDLTTLHGSRFGASGSALAIATPGPLEHALALAEAATAGWPAGGAAPTPVPEMGSARVATSALPADLAYLVLLAPAVPRGHPDADALNVAAVTLGGGATSRLFVEVREKRGLCYGIGCRFGAFAALGALRIEAAVPPDHLDEAIKAILDQISEQAAHASEAEVDRARALLLGGLAMESDRPETWARRYSRDLVQLGRVRTYEEIVRAMEAVRAADVRRLTGEYLAPEQLRLSVAGPGVRRRQVAKLLPR